MKGSKDRITVMPASLYEHLIKHLAKVSELHQRDLREGCGRATLPFALDRKYTNAGREFRPCGNRARFLCFVQNRNPTQALYCALFVVPPPTLIGNRGSGGTLKGLALVCVS